MVTSFSMFYKGDNPIFGKSVTKLEIDDEATGPHIVITQHYDDDRNHVIKIDYDEIDDFVDLLKRLKEIIGANNESFL